MLFDSSSYNHLPVLKGLARQPYLRPNGSLMIAAGYDAETAMFGVFNPREFTIPDSPTRAQAEAALVLLNDLLKEFSFTSETDRAAALAAILTAAIRPSLAHAPMTHVRAHRSARALRQSILHHAFTGKLVPQDPNDEPASKLLKRIAAEREERVRQSAAAKHATKKAKPVEAKTKTLRRRTAKPPGRRPS